jgi:prevent-host-death family protein
MDVTIAEAQDRLPSLIDAVKNGERVVITDDGKPVAELNPPPAEAQGEPRKRREVQFGFMRGQIVRQPGWDDPIDIDDFLTGNF